MENKTILLTMATKEQVIEKHIEEFDRIINYVRALKLYCEKVLEENEMSMCEGCGECFNDPENRPKHVFVRELESDVLFEVAVKTSEKIQCELNDFLSIEPISENLKCLLESCEDLEFPAEFFPENRKIEYVEKPTIKTIVFHKTGDSPLPPFPFNK